MLFKINRPFKVIDVSTNSYILSRNFFSVTILSSGQIIAFDKRVTLVNVIAVYAEIIIIIIMTLI